MVYVGRFTESDLLANKDREAINERKKLLPEFRHVYAKEIKKGRKIVALDVYLSAIYL